MSRSLAASASAKRAARFRAREAFRCGPCFDRVDRRTCCLLALVGALAPPTAKDTLLYHFAVPKAFVAQDSNAFVEGNIASYLALGGEMHNVWAMLLAGLADREQPRQPLVL